MYCAYPFAHSPRGLSSRCISHSIDHSFSLSFMTHLRFVPISLSPAINKWIHQWRRNNFQNGKVQNKDLFVTLDTALREREGKVEFVFVNAHSGIEGNEAAHRLAYEAASAKAIPGSERDAPSGRRRGQEEGESEEKK